HSLSDKPGYDSVSILPDSADRTGPKSRLPSNLWNFCPRPTHHMCVGDDAGLLLRARKGNQEAFSELFRRYQRAIYRYSAHMCGPIAADDVVQETFLAVLRQGGRSEPPRGEVIGYLLGIARHFVLKRLTFAGEPALDDDVERAVSSEASPLDQLTRAEAIEAVRTAIQTLPAVYREAVVLCELQELDYAAAAGVMQCPIGTVRSRLARARSLLHTKLLEERQCKERNRTSAR